MNIIPHALGLHMNLLPENLKLLIEENEWEARQIIYSIKISDFFKSHRPALNVIVFVALIFFTYRFFIDTEHMNIICFGDSITHAASFPEKDRWPVLLQQKLDTLKPSTFSIYNRGISGETTQDGLERINEDVLALLPGIVLIEFGFNDANVRDYLLVSRVSLLEYKRNLEEIYRVVKEKNGKPIFIINHSIRGAISDADPYYKSFIAYNEALRDTANKLSAPIIDLPLIMEEKKVNLDEFLDMDGLHLTAKGNHIYADMIFAGLKPLLEQN